MMLGAVLAGGRATRFGSDKALAEIGGQTLLALAIQALQRSCDRVVVVGRDAASVDTIPDWPAPDLGPLAGIAASLRHAEAAGFDAVLTCGVDSVGLPPDLDRILDPSPAYLTGQPVVGLWPATAARAVEAILAGNGRHSMLALAHAIGARPVNLAANPANINTPADLAAAESRHGL